MKKRGSLELSVNAIVIFIIAFAMLGVGLFFINKVRNTMDVDTSKFLPANTMSNPPTSDSPLTIDDVKMKAKEQKPVNIGIYAKDAPLEGVKFRIVSCTEAATNKKISKTITENSETPPKRILKADYTCDVDGAACDPAIDPASTQKLLPEISGAYDGKIEQGEAGTVPSFINGNNALKPGVYSCTFAALISPTATPTENQIVRTNSFRLEIIS